MALWEPEGKELLPLVAPDRDEPSKAFQRSGLVVDGALGA
jgi:hypothetical protein